MLVRVPPVDDNSTNKSKARFGARVRWFRNRLGISQEALAGLAELDRTYIAHIERGARNVSLATMERLARALHVSTSVLLSEAGANEITGDATPGAEVRKSVDILLVEDRRSDAELILHAFRRAGVTNSIHVVYDGAEALDYLFCTGPYSHRANEVPPKFIMLDLNLPKVSGMEVLRRIKADSRTRTIAVVVLTALQSDESVAEAVRLGAADYIVKPVDFSNFSEVVRKLRFGWTLLEPSR